MYHKQLINEYTFPYTYTRLIFSAQTYFLNNIVQYQYLKGVCHEIFDLHFFFMIRTHLGP